MEPYIYTAADLEVERGVADWGSPQATVTVKAGPLAGEIYRLRSPRGLLIDGKPLDRDPDHDHYMLDLLRNRNGYELREVDGWYGSYPTDDLDEALEFLPETLTEWVADETDRWQLSAVLHELGSAVRDASDYDTRRSRHSLRERWPRIRQLVLAAEMQLFPKPVVPPPPLPPHYSFHAPILRLEERTKDGRVLCAGGEYGLMWDRSIRVNLVRAHVTAMTGQVVHLSRLDSLVWAYGWVDDAATAQALMSGETFLSADVHTTGIEHSGGLALFDGGLIRSAVILPADQNPWGGWQ